MGYFFLALLIVTGFAAHLVIDRLVRLMAAGVLRSGAYLVVTFAILICYSVICLAAPSPLPNLSFYNFFAAILFLDFAFLVWRERRLYRLWQSRSADMIAKSRRSLRWATPLLGSLLVLNSIFLVVTGTSHPFGPGGSPTPSLGPSFGASRPTPNGTEGLAIANGRTDVATRSFIFVALVDLSSLTKAGASPTPLNASAPFAWSLSTGIDLSPLHPLTTVGQGASLSSSVSATLSCAVATSAPSTLVLSVKQGTNNWPHFAIASLRVAANTCPALVALGVSGQLRKGVTLADSAVLPVVATVRNASGALAWSLSGLANGKSTTLSGGPVDVPSAATRAAFEVTIPCGALAQSPPTTLVLDISDAVGLVGWNPLPIPAAIPPGVCGH